MDKFIVECRKIKRRDFYYVKFPYQQQVLERIRNLPKKEREWNDALKAWEVKTIGLFNLLQSYKNSDKIHFNFLDDEKVGFIDKVKKDFKKQAEEKKYRQELEIKKKKWVKLKSEFEKDYEQYVDITHKNLKEGIKLYPFQVAGAMFLNETKNTLLAFEMGLGKAQDIDSQLLTPNGWIKMGDVKVGDYVIGSDGNPTQVLGVYPQGEKDIYELTFNDGSKASCCKEHLWNVNNEFDYWDNLKFNTLTLEQIMDDGLVDEKGRYKYYIPLTEAVNFKEKKTYKKPYQIGKDYIEGNINKIPHEYIYNTIDYRLDLLMGIFDKTNFNILDDLGHLIEIILPINKECFILSIRELILSLGGTCQVYNDENGFKLEIKLPYNFKILKKKRTHLDYLDVFNENLPYRYIKEINFIGKKEAQCIYVDAKDSLYLTDDYIVTHNTIISIAYVEMNDYDKILVLTPNSLKFNYFNEVEKFTHSKAHVVNWKKNKYTIEESKYVIVNYEFFRNSNQDKADKKFNDLNLGKIDALIADECFTYDTLIDTNKGSLKIGDIVENKLDVKVLTYNHRLKKIETKSINKYLYNGYKDVINVGFSNGVKLECTPEHKFYSLTENKYKLIKDFKIGEKVIYKKKEKKSANKNNTLSTLWCKFQTKSIKTKILFKDMFSNWNRLKTRKKLRTKGKKIVSTLRGCFSNSTFKSEKVLFKKLFRKMENVARRHKEKNVHKRSDKEKSEINKKILQRKSRSKKKNFFSNEEKQSNDEAREYRKNERKNERKNFSFKGWKWSVNKTTIKSIFETICNNKSIYGNGVYDSNKKTINGNECGSNITTNTLQNRYWYTRIKDWYRSRWKKSQIKKMEISRQEEDGNIEIVWVENIEVLELGNRRKCRYGCGRNKKAYDLEIKDNHNYFANGILVSNCHALKSSKSNSYKNFKRIFKDSAFKNNKVSMVYMSGTPTPNAAHELYTVLNQISPIDFPTKDHFYKYYLGMKYDANGYGYVTDYTQQRLEELFHAISPYTYRKKKDDVLKELPDKTYQNISLELKPKDYVEYKHIENDVTDELFGSKTNGNLMITILLRLRQFTAKLKAKELIEFIDAVIGEGEKLVVVDEFKDSLYELYEKYKDISVLHTGDQTVEERGEYVKQFQDPNSPVKIFFGSIATCNYGLTLTQASKMLVLTMPYSVGKYDQVCDRLHRLTQKNSVNIYTPIFKNTIDEMVYYSVENKRVEINKVLDNEDYESKINDSVLGDVVNILKRRI